MEKAEMKSRLLGILESAATLVLLVTAAWALPGCKQGVGEVCQIDDDCKDGLVCNAGSNQCQEPAGPGIDAGPGDGDGDGDGDD